MSFHVRPIGVCIVRTALVVAGCAALFVAGGTLAPKAQAASSGLAYSQVTRLLFGQSATPAPGAYFTGSFDGDYNAAVAAAGAPPKKGLFAAFQMAKNAMNQMKNGYAVTESYWGGMKREDKPDQTATIEIPAKYERIELNLANKTYIIYNETPKVGEYETPEPVMPRSTEGPQPSPQPGTAKVSVTVISTDLGPKTLAGEQTEGYKIESKLVSTQATGSCSNSTADVVLISFYSKYPEPKLAPPPSAKATLPPMAAPSLPPNQFKVGCKPTYTANIHKGKEPPYGHLILWQYFAGSGSSAPAPGAAAAGGEMGGGSSMSGGAVIERGNVRSLGPGDASLFQVPAGFTQQSPPS